MTAVPPVTATAEQARRTLTLLERQGQTLATAESLTCGLIAATLADIPGASAVLRGGLAAYATEIKVQVLGVDADVVGRDGVISPACAVAMARGATSLFASDWAVSATGVAGPEAQEGHLPGTVFVSVSGPGTSEVERLNLSGGRNEIRAATVAAALDLLERRILAVRSS